VRRFALCAVLALPAAAAPLRSGSPALSLRVETAYVEPGDGSSSSRGAGAGVGAAWRLTDQLSVVGGTSQSLLSVRQLPGGPRVARGLTMISAGLEAMLDATPIAPFLQLCFVQLLPQTAAGYSLATRTALGADWRIAPAFALGLSVRTLTPLDSPSGVTPLGGTEIAARFVWVPGATR